MNNSFRYLDEDDPDILQVLDNTDLNWANLWIEHLKKKKKAQKGKQYQLFQAKGSTVASILSI